MEREKLLMDECWKFQLQDVPYSPVLGHDITYLASKAEHAKGAATRDFYDMDWRTVNLPHDYVVEGIPNPTRNEDHGSLLRDNAWYRRSFKLNVEDRQHRVTLLFDGVASTCIVWVNGYLLCRNYTGGIGFEVDFSDVAKYGEDVNVVSVYINNSDFEGWYYEGGGIYRHVWLCKTNRVCVNLWGTYVRTSKGKDEIWETDIETTIRNDNYDLKEANLISEIVDINGNVVEQIQSCICLPARKNTEVNQVVLLKQPTLWSINIPNLYTLKTKIFVSGEQVDEYLTTFGYRMIEFNPNTGFYLNGENMKLKGMSNHQDYSGLGVAVPDRVQEFRIQRLKDMGCNAYRCAHNPHAPEIYDACDRLGMMVMDENRWLDSSIEGRIEIESLVKRDRNHPSVIMWSLFNEEPDMDNERGRKTMASISEYCHELDSTRPVTAASFFGILTPGGNDSSDIIGINYHIELYDKVHRMYPDKALYASETGRGYNKQGIESWKQVDIRPYMMGAFPWTGWQYRGESRWPRLFSDSGTINQCGNPTPSYYMYKAYWTNTPFAQICPHWNWDGMEGKNINVTVFTNGDVAELFLNGVSLGIKPIDPYFMAKWSVPYKLGKLKAVVTKKGIIYAQNEVVTTGKPEKLKLVIENDRVNADGEDIAIVTAYAVDGNDNVVPTANGYHVNFTTNEYGVILATGNTDTEDHDLPQKPCRKTFEGYCQVIIKSSDKAGNLIIKASTKELGEASIEIKTLESERRPYVPIEFNRYISLWKMSPIITEPVDMKKFIKEDHQMDDWKTMEVGRGSPMVFQSIFPRSFMMTKPTANINAYVMYYAESVIPKHDGAYKNIKLHFECIEGSVEAVFICGDKIISTKRESFDAGILNVEFPRFISGDRVIVYLLIKANTAFCSLNRPVRWIFE
ncbi:MAG TPA: glycoside hydrolase family 2 TIM barrel-domain containing protein [Ruminiclostridium sp.]